MAKRAFYSKSEIRIENVKMSPIAFFLCWGIHCLYDHQTNKYTIHFQIEVKEEISHTNGFWVASRAFVSDK